MPRIRTIKPEFATDGKIRRLSDSTALFFILLWNHCDDEGYFELDTWELAMKTGRWRSQDMMKMLWSLHGHGLVRLSTGDGVGMVRCWKHQRIDKPRGSKWKNKEIQWDDAKPLKEDSESVPRKERIGKDRKGSIVSSHPKNGENENKNQMGKTNSENKKNKPDEFTLSSEPPSEDSVPQKPKAKILSEEQNARRASWEAYCEAYKNRYGVEPIRNATTNSQNAAFVRRVGAKEAPEVLKFYLAHNNSFYVSKMHQIGLALSDAEKLYAEWKSGRTITNSTARQVERVSNTANNLKAAFEKIEAEKNSNNSVQDVQNSPSFAFGGGGGL